MKKRLAIADPPYLGCGSYYDHPDTLDWDKPETHIALVDRLEAEFDGWVLHSSATAAALALYAPLIPQNWFLAGAVGLNRSPRSSAMCRSPMPLNLYSSRQLASQWLASALQCGIGSMARQCGSPSPCSAG